MDPSTSYEDTLAPQSAFQAATWKGMLFMRPYRVSFQWFLVVAAGRSWSTDLPGKITQFMKLDGESGILTFQQSL